MVKSFNNDRVLFPTAVLVILSILHLSCLNPTSDLQSKGTVNRAGFSLRTSLAAKSTEGGSRTISPSGDLDIASYSLTATSPGTDSFAADFSATEVFTKDGLTSGLWSFSLDAKASDGKVLYSGTASTTLVEGKRSEVRISLSPAEGMGSVSFALTWPAGDIVSPLATFTIVEANGSPASTRMGTPSYSVGKAEGTASLAVGDYVVQVKLFDSSTLRFAKSYALQVLNERTTPLILDLTSAMLNSPIAPPSFDLAAGEYEWGSPLTLSAEPGAAIYYSTDGGDPLGGSGLLYAGPVPLASNGVIKARALMDGVLVSAASETAYTVRYVLRFDDQGATTSSDPATITLYPPAAPLGSLPSEPAKTGYDFGGWYTAPAGGGEAFSEATVVESSLSLFAKWSPKVFTVSFDEQSPTTGTNPAAMTYTYPATIIDSLPTAPTKTSFVFGGWYTGTGGSGTRYLIGSEVTSSLALFAYWASPDSFLVGQVGPSGGKVFYDKGSYSNSWRYLEAAPADMPNTNGYRWGVNNISIGVTSGAIGAGKANTDTLVSTQGTEELYAAKACADYAYGGYDDWFLPSLYELDALYTQRQSMGGYTVGYYYSSTEFSASYADIHHFDTGSLDYSGQVWKSQPCAVRPVRQF